MAASENRVYWGGQEVIAAKPWWASKTVWLGILELTVGILTVVIDSELTAGDLESALLIAAGVLTVILRFLTERPIRLTHKTEDRVRNEDCRPRV